MLQETSKSDRVSLREGSRLGLTAVGAASVALLPVHHGGGIQGAFPPWRPLVVINDNNNNTIMMISDKTGQAASDRGGGT